MKFWEVKIYPSPFCLSNIFNADAVKDCGTTLCLLFIFLEKGKSKHKLLKIRPKCAIIIAINAITVF